MARLIGPSEASRLVFTVVAFSGVTNGLLKSKAGRPATYYVDPDPAAEPTPSMLTTLADIRTLAGVAYADSTVTIDTYSMLPEMQFPDGVDSLLVVVDNGPPWRVYAREDDRLDSLATALTAESSARVSRSIDTTSPMTGGGDLSANRTIGILTHRAYTAAAGEVLANDPYFGTPGTRAAFIAALDAAETLGKGTVVRIPAGLSIDVVTTLSMSGRSCQIIGAGAGRTSTDGNISTIKASAQTGPVINFAGYLPPYNFLGKVRPLAQVLIQGSGVADPTKANSGIRMTSMSSAYFHDIAIMGTGGPCLEMAQSTGNAVYLCDFERIIMSPPVSAKANDVPWFYANECNGNRFRGFGFRSTSSTGDVGPSGAVVIEGNASFSPHDNLFDAWWFEFLHPPTNGTLFHHAGNASLIKDFQFFDCTMEAGAAGGTSFFRLAPPTVSDFGGNEITGLIPGDNNTFTYIDTGVDVRQSRNVVSGAKGYRGKNVTLASGVDRCYVNLRGAYSGASTAGIVDNSGVSNNHLIDEYLQTETRPAGWLTNGAPTLTQPQVGQRGVALASGESNADRRSTTAGNVSATSGQLVLTYFVASVTETINQLVLYTTSVAGAGLTLVRYGVYSVAVGGNLTLVASTVNDTTLLAATNTRYPGALLAPWAKVAGQRYAVGYLCVGTTQPAPLQVGATTLSLQDIILSQDPRLTGIVNAQTDLPSSVAAGSATSSRRYPYVEMLP